MIVLWPGMAPVESTLLPYSTNTYWPAMVMESKPLTPFGVLANVLTESTWACGGAGFDAVVEAGVVRRHAVDVGKGTRLTSRSRIVHVDDGAVGAAGQNQIAVGGELHRVGIG